MKRRAFLKSVVASGGMLGGLGLPALAAARRKPNIVVITDIAPDTPVQRLRAMLASFLAKGLPVSCIVRTVAANGDRMGPDNAVASLLRELLAQSPGLLEIVGWAPDIASQSEFFQARAAYRARKDLVEALVPDPAGAQAGLQLQSLACEYSATPLSPEGVRSAGIRNVLLLPRTSATVTSELWGNGLVRLLGGTRANLFAALDHLGKLAPEQYQNVILLSVRDNSTRSEHVLAAAATVFANVALRHEADQWISNLRLGDLQLRDGSFSFQRRVGLHLFEPSAKALHLSAGFEAFKAELTASGIAFSTGPGSLVPPGAPTRQGYWIVTEPELPNARKTGPEGQADPETLVRLNCSGVPGRVGPAGPAFLSAGIGLALNPRAGGIQGIDECGNLHVPVVTPSTQGRSGTKLLSGTDNTNELVVAIPPDILATAAQRNTLRAELRRLTDDWVTEIVPVAEMARPIAPASPLISLYRHTVAYEPRMRPDPVVLSADQRQSLLEDAVTAWSYFYRMTDRRTGLVPATVFYSGGRKTALKSATMWDMASHINALMAAADLDLIDEGGFRDSIAKILLSIKGKTKDGRRLPSEWIRTDRRKSGNTNFDGCDGGRLLAALKNLSQHRFGGSIADNLVRSWDLDKIVVDRKIFSVIDGELLSTYDSHCAHYSARAFRAWGMDVASPYEVLADRPAHEGKMALLDVVANIGPIGAEPLLLEAVDFGLSPETAYIADVLFAAQYREYETTGDLVCVSEGPIDRAPWFTYQGLQFNAPDRTWTIGTVRNDEKYATPEFQAANRVFSTKAAFLWAAHKPNGFSDILLNYARKAAKSTVGFASSIYSATGEPTRNYSDINTNGIILQTIARMLADPPTPG